MKGDDAQTWIGKRNGQTSLSHYYGDIVRVLFLVVAVLLGLSVPLSGNIQIALLAGAPVIIGLVVLAGFTNPHGKIVLVLDAVVAALGILVAETFAVAAFSADQMYVFVILETVCVIFLIALYFSVKNVRAALMHKIGKIDGVGEFDEPDFMDVKDEGAAPRP